jgi:hypothetical protein
MDYLQTIDNCTSHQGHETRNIVMLKEARVGKRLIAYTFSIVEKLLQGKNKKLLKVWSSH